MIIIEETGARIKLKDYDSIREILRELDQESTKIARRYLKGQRRAARSFWFSDWIGIVAQVIGVALMVFGAMYLISR